MDPQGRHNNLRCPCYDVQEEFQKIVDMKDTGLDIYRHTSQIGYVRKSEEKPIDNNNEDMFVLHNTQNTDLNSTDIMAALDIYGISCPRCAYIIKNAKKMLEIVPKIKSNNIMGICEHCRRKITACVECDKVVKRFVSTRGEMKDKKQRVLRYKSDLNLLLSDIIRKKKLLKEKKRSYSEIDFVSIHYNSPTSPQQPVVQDVFEKLAMKTKLSRSFKSDRSIPLHSDLPTDKKRAKFVGSIHNNVVGTKADLFYSRSLDNITYHDNTLADDAFDHENKGNLNFGSDTTLLKYDLKSGKIRFGHEHQPTNKKGGVTKQTKPSLKENKLTKSMPHIESTERISLKYKSEKDFLSAISSAMNDTQYTEFNYYFPKELDMKSNKPIKIISSSELISDTQNMLQERAEKEKFKLEQERIRKQEEKEKHRLEKLEKEKETERLLAEEQSRKLKEEALRLAEEKKKELMIHAEKHQTGGIPSVDGEPSPEKSTESKTNIDESKKQLKDIMSDSSKDGKIRGKQSKDIEDTKVESTLEIKVQGDGRSKVEKRKETSEPEMGYKQSKSEVEISKSVKEYPSKKDKESLHTTKEKKDESKIDDRSRIKREDDDVIRKDKEKLKTERKFESKRRKEDDDVPKKEKEDRRGENKTKKDEHDVIKKELEEGRLDDKYINRSSKADDSAIKKEKQDQEKKGDKNEEKKREEDDKTLKKEKKGDKNEEKKRREDDKTLKKEKESTKKENKLESKKSKEDIVLSKTGKEKKDGHGLKDSKDSDEVKKEKIDRHTTDKQKDEKRAETITKTSKNESEDQPGKVDKAAADEFKKLLAADAKQRELDRKQKKIQEEEERKAKEAAEKKLGDSAKLKCSRASAKKHSKKSQSKKELTKREAISSPIRKSITKDLSFGKIKMVEPSCDDLLLKLVKVHQEGPRLKLKQEENNIIKEILTRHKRHNNNKSCLICTDSNLQLDLESMVDKGDIDKIANIIIGEKIYKYKAPVRDIRRDQQINNFKAIDEEICKSDTDDDIHQVPSEKIKPNMTIQVTAKEGKMEMKKPEGNWHSSWKLYLEVSKSNQDFKKTVHGS